MCMLNFDNELIKKPYNWILHDHGDNYLKGEKYCASRDIFMARLDNLYGELQNSGISEKLLPLIVAVCGEIGNNSFDHNGGSWRDIPGIYFSSDMNNKLIVLADRGQGIKKTLQRAIPQIKNHKDALKIAFTEIISGRLPEHRGNGLKFVAETVMKNNMEILFQSGNASVNIKKKSSYKTSNVVLKGCLAALQFNSK